MRSLYATALVMLICVIVVILITFAVDFLFGMVTLLVALCSSVATGFLFQGKLEEWEENL